MLWVLSPLTTGVMNTGADSWRHTIKVKLHPFGCVTLPCVWLPITLCVSLSVFLICYRRSFILTVSFLSHLQILHEFIRVCPAIMSRISCVCGGGSGLKVLCLFPFHELLMQKQNYLINPLLIYAFCISYLV